MRFDYYADPGHGWLKVPRQLLVTLGIAAAISPYSYQRGDWAYLEEDSDYARFCRAMAAQGIPIALREHVANRPSRIRGYAPYTLSALAVAA